MIIIPLRIPGYKNRIPSRATVDSLTRFKIFDLRSRTISKSAIKINDDIYKVPRVHKFTTNARLRSRIYYGYANSPVIHYTDDLIYKIGVDVPSEHHQEYISYLKYPSPYETWKHMFHYMSLFSDPYRSLLYRVVKLPMADPEQHDGVDELNTIWDRASIMVLDPDLSLLGEFVLPVHGRYSWSECFVGRKGFYLLRSPNHPHYSESKITYDIFVCRVGSSI